MKPIKLITCSLTSYLIIFSSLLMAQVSNENDADKATLLEVARNIMTTSNSCALISLDQDGSPKVRAMDPFTPEPDFTVWFGTNPNSRKVKEIQKDNRVNLYYIAPDASGYVTIQGTAEIINDKDKKKQYWKDEWTAFYPNKEEGYVLIKVTPQHLEVLSDKHGVKNDPKSWQPPTVSFN